MLQKCPAAIYTTLSFAAFFAAILYFVDVSYVIGQKKLDLRTRLGMILGFIVLFIVLFSAFFAARGSVTHGYLAQKVDNIHIAECYRLVNDDERRACVENHAISLKQPDICNYLTSKVFRTVKETSARSRCKKEVALYWEDGRLCDTVHNRICEISVARPVINEALRTEDAQHCNKITTRIEKETCMWAVAKETNNPELCSETGINTNMCYFLFARKFNNITLCNMPTSEKFQKNCRGVVEKQNTALKTLNISLCDHRDVSKFCAGHLALETGDWNWCEQQPLYRIVECYLFLAEMTQNKSICNLIPIEERENACLELF